MSEQKSKENISVSSEGAATTTTASSGATPTRRRMAQNFLLIWLDASFDASKEDCQHTMTQLRSVVNDVNIFNQPGKAIDFLTELHHTKVFLIVKDAISQQIVPLIHDISQLHTIYIFSDNESSHKQWTKQWNKIEGLYTEIKPICAALQLAVKQCDQDSIAVSFVTADEVVSSQNLNQLEPSFMYTQIFKEILLEMNHNEQSIKDFITYCRNGNYGSPNNITRFENEYQPKLAIWWYTFPSFIYSLLNCALRTIEADTIIKMGFFIRHLHEQIQELHQKQVSGYLGNPFTVYRGQGLCKTDFEKLLKSKGGLMSFNNFLSTSREREVSVGFAVGASTDTDMVGILFKIAIDPSISSALFASIREVSYLKTEEEILFSMHTVFRVGEINKTNNNNSFYQVELQLTADDDRQLRTLTERIRKEVVGATGWQRLGRLLNKLSQLDKAEELYNALLEQATDEGEKALYYTQLGFIKNGSGDNEKAIEYYEKALEIDQKTLRPDHPLVATSYGNIGAVYKEMGEYPKALLFCEKALKIQQETLPRNHLSLATSYNTIGEVYRHLGEYPKALLFCEKALKIQQETLPPNHPSLATSYSCIGEVYRNIGEYSKTLSFYEKALSFYEKGVEISKKTLPPNHPDLATAYSSIGVMYMHMGEYSKALSFYEKDVEISQKTLPRNHPSLAISYNNIGTVYHHKEQYSEALPFYEKSLEIREKTLRSNHPDFLQSYNNMARAYESMKEYSQALAYFERSLNIVQHSLPPNHPHRKYAHENIERLKKKM